MGLEGVGAEQYFRILRAVAELHQELAAGAAGRYGAAATFTARLSPAVSMAATAARSAHMPCEQAVSIETPV